MTTNRRHFLTGLQGAALALPFLESHAASQQNVAKRMVHYYVPIGVNRKYFFLEKEIRILLTSERRLKSQVKQEILKNTLLRQE